jgi:CMP-N-acetylneuraminic acid synthetase
MGGYDESVDCQDGYDLWLKMFDRFKMYNVNLPLFYYRRHAVSLSTDQARILRARRALKERYVRDRCLRVPSVLAIIPVRNTSPVGEGWALRQLGSAPVLAYSLDEAKACPLIARTVVVTEDEAVATFARARGIEVVMRPPHLARANSPIEPTALYTIDQVRADGFDPDVVCLLHANSPLRRVDHITEAINTLLIFRPDSVISVCENTRLQYQHRVNGLEPIFSRRELRLEREALYEENGALYVSWTRAITPQSVVGKRVGHVVMTRESSVHLDSTFDWWMAEQLTAVRGTTMAQGWDI